MTREEAKKALEEDLPKVSQFSPKMASAYKVAISALTEELSEDGTLTVHVSDGSKVNRVLVKGDNIFGGLYYPDSAENKGEWIPISERLPESSGVYIVTREFTDDGIECADLADACYFDGTSTWHNDNRINHGREYVDKKIKAWMPLPEPYKVESEDKK